MGLRCSVRVKAEAVVTLKVRVKVPQGFYDHEELCDMNRRAKEDSIGHLRRVFMNDQLVELEDDPVVRFIVGEVEDDE
jgi:hypothetical protein